MDGVEGGTVGDGEGAEAAEELEPLGAGGDAVGGVEADAGVVGVAGGEAADGDDEGGEARFAPFLRVAIVLRGGGVRLGLGEQGEGTYGEKGGDVEEREDIG